MGRGISFFASFAETSGQVAWREAFDLLLSKSQLLFGTPPGINCPTPLLPSTVPTYWQTRVGLGVRSRNLHFLSSSLFHPRWWCNVLPKRISKEWRGEPLNFRGSFEQGRPETKFARHSMDVRIEDDKLCKMVIHVWIDMNTERIEVEKFKYNIVISIGLIIRKFRISGWSKKFRFDCV